MTKIAMVLHELHRAENHLRRDLLAVAERHQAEPEIVHVARTVAVWSHEHMTRLEELAPRHGTDLDPTPAALGPTGRHGDPGLLLLSDLRGIHRDAAGVALDWELLGQAAQTLRPADLVELAQSCRPQTARQMAWANGQLKQSATHVLAT